MLSNGHRIMKTWLNASCFNQGIKRGLNIGMQFPEKLFSDLKWHPEFSKLTKIVTRTTVLSFMFVLHMWRILDKTWKDSRLCLNIWRFLNKTWRLAIFAFHIWRFPDKKWRDSITLHYQLMWPIMLVLLRVLAQWNSPFMI